MEVTASAPGKVFVVGEYGVVCGGPAVIATVTRRLRARVRALRGQGCLTVRTRHGEVRCALGTESVAALPAESRFAAAAALVAARALHLGGLDLEIETTSALDRDGVKTGLGGSAAVTAAVVAGLYGVAERAPAPERDLEERIAAGVYAHRLVQGGGSGADVVAATVGGMVWTDHLDGGDVPGDVSACVARMREAPPIRFARLRLPSPLVLEVAATGKAVATGPRVARFAALAGPGGGSPAAATVRAWNDGMRAASELFRAACERGDARLLCAAVEGAAGLLSRLGALAGMPLWTGELRRACRVAASLGAAAKPSGAGGGDCAVAVVEESARERLRAAWAASDVQPLAVDLDPAGAVWEVAA